LTSSASCGWQKNERHINGSNRFPHNIKLNPRQFIALTTIDTTTYMDYDRTQPIRSFPAVVWGSQNKLHKITVKVTTFTLWPQTELKSQFQAGIEICYVFDTEHKPHLAQFVALSKPLSFQRSGHPRTALCPH